MSGADLFSPRSVTALLRGMAGVLTPPPTMMPYQYLGVDGTEWMRLPATSPRLARSRQERDKTIDGDLLNPGVPLLLGKASAGYMTAKSWSELIWAIYVNDVLYVSQSR